MRVEGRVEHVSLMRGVFLDSNMILIIYYIF